MNDAHYQEINEWINNEFDRMISAQLMCCVRLGEPQLMILRWWGDEDDEDYMRQCDEWESDCIGIIDNFHPIQFINQPNDRVEPLAIEWSDRCYQWILFLVCPSISARQSKSSTAMLHSLALALCLATIFQFPHAIHHARIPDSRKLVTTVLS